MKSAVFYGKHDLRVEESAKPAVGRRDVLINVKACGVCGTDVHIYEGDKGAADVTPPTILGHEFAGVVEAGTTNGVITDISGKFTLMVDPNGKIKVSYIGYQSQVLDVKGRNSFNIKLKEDSEMLDEVVVTGYGGKQLRTKVTNSISKVSEESLKVGVFSNPAQALSGAVSGLKVTQSSGNPGSTPTIVLRGGTEWDGSGSPLVMVDGQLRDGLNDINPEDIESMEVLKDAGATALYGARASNGVILITTKTGKVGKAEINLKAKVGMNYINNPYDFLGAKDFITAWKSHFTLPLLGKYDCPLWPRYDCPFWFK